MNCTVQGDSSFLAGLLFLEAEVLPYLYAPHVTQLNFQYVRCPEIDINCKVEQATVSGVIGKQLFDVFDVTFRTDRISGDVAPLWWMI